ncbi:MAG: thiamine pyrophosphate-binding protein [Spirochaetaceae bacterium]|nr:thiamine pyrophosphate-binding protein [Spirochaetaceae bacterium]
MKGEKPIPLIRPLENGPLEVEHLENFTNSRNEAIQTESPMQLCRCGHSRTKPFCDNSHEAAGFTSEKCNERIPDVKEHYRGRRITIHDNRGICSHAGFCTSLLPLVFKGGEPWIDPDAADMQTIIDVIEKCPSGALSYSIESENEIKDHPGDAEIHIDRNGAYQVRGGIEIENTDLGDDASDEHYTLCRCGESCNKPRCDGSHWYADFRDDEGLTISAANRKRENPEPQWIRAAAREDFAGSDKLVIRISGRTVVLTVSGGIYGAIEGVCPHQRGPLSEGTLAEGHIHCPWHGHRFDRISGKSLDGDADTASFPVEERKDGIYVQIASPSRSEWTISHVMVETMVNWGVDTVFGMVGHSNLGVAEAIRLQENLGALRYIGIRHEGAAAFAASGYAKASGRPAACLSIAGPGATNLLTGLWDAKVDRVPVLALTGQVQTQFFGPGAFQEIDLPDAFHGVADFSQTVLPGSRHAELMSLALKHAILNRDVAHLIFPDEVQTIDAGEEAPDHPDGRLTPRSITPPQEAVAEAGYRLGKSRKPVVIVGFGAREAMPEVLAFAEKLNAPVLTTFKAKGQISDYHPLGAGVLGRSGTPVASTLMNGSDLLIVFGASFSQHTGIDTDKAVIQVDFDPMALGKFHSISTPVLGDCAVSARLLADLIDPHQSREGTAGEVAALWESWTQEKSRRASKNRGRGLSSALIFDRLSEAIDEDALIAVDVGNNTYSYGRYFRARGQRTIMSGYLGSIGFAFPAAMGAWAAQTGRRIVSISGDGGFGQYMNEFLTAVKYKMNITHILLNNNELGKISKEQQGGGWDVWQTGLTNPSFARYAENCGGFGVEVKKIDDLSPALTDAFDYDGPSLVEISSDSELI